MQLYEILTIVAIILGPILAVQIDKYIYIRRDNKNRKLWIFKTLMATRGAILSAAHVEALNRIDLEFSNGKKYYKVITSWKEYFDNLCQKQGTEEQIIIWSTKNEELLANLLFEMGQSLGYSFDKVLIKRNIYSPIGHGKIEKENELIRQNFLNILQGEKTFPVSFSQNDLNQDTVNKQQELQDLLITYYKKQNLKSGGIENGSLH
ncbi:MAG TPA: DUF6680 family protein [Bacteroidia bacterium]|nr:DUF6680 family protein [Bacteroidia bacterium]